MTFSHHYIYLMAVVTAKLAEYDLDKNFVL